MQNLGKYICAFGTITMFSNSALAEKSSGGFPQLDVSTYASQVFWLVIAFSSLYFLMSKKALPKVGEVLDRRQKSREDNLLSAEEDQAKMEEVKSLYEAKLTDAHNKSQELLAKTAKELSDIAHQKNEEFANDAKKRLKATDKKIEVAKDDALKEISDIAADIAVEAVKKIVSVKVTKTEAKKAVKAALKTG